MKVLVVDAGARGHAIAKKHLAEGHEVMVGPGNDGMKHDGIALATEVSLKNPESILAAAKYFQPAIVEVAQDDALALGTVDLLLENRFRAFGPTQAAARIESDKAWAREFMQKYNIPIPEYHTFSRADPELNLSAITYANELIAKYGSAYFKAAGLDAGKGVKEAIDARTASAALSAMMKKDAAATFLIEEGLDGEEFSYYAMTDGSKILVFPSAQDNKRVFDNDLGDYTGGMGANAPALVTSGLEQRILEEILQPTIDGMREEGHRYTGILYLGGKVCSDGSIKVVEFNARWGDPEVQVVLPGMQFTWRGKPINYAAAMIDAATDSSFDMIGAEHDGLKRVNVVMASKGYPGDYSAVKGTVVEIDWDHLPKDIEILSAGLKEVDGNMVANGGRVLNIVATAPTTYQALNRALHTIENLINFPNSHYRTDIARRDIEREQ